MNTKVVLPAVLVSLNTSVWTAQKLDRKTSQEVDVQHATKTRAGNYNKHLMAGVDSLDTVKSVAAATRVEFHRITQPWSDNGDRLLAAERYFDFKNWADTRTQAFDAAVKEFVSQYATNISVQAFKLGSLFDRSEYPDPADVAHRFGMVFSYTPLPQSGDFRLDSFNSTLSLVERELTDKYESMMAARVDTAIADAWDRVHKALKHMAEKMLPDADGKKRRLHDTTLENMYELCTLMSSFNVTGDPKMEQCRRDIENALAGVSTDVLRVSEDARKTIHTKVTGLMADYGLE